MATDNQIIEVDWVTQLLLPDYYFLKYIMKYITYLTIIQGVVNRTVSFKSDRHDHVDPSSHTNVAHRVQKLRIQNDQRTCRQMKPEKKSQFTTSSKLKFSLENEIAEFIIKLNVFVICNLF